MVDSKILIELLARQEISNSNKILLCLDASDGKPLQVKDIQEIAINSGLRIASKLNISSILGRSKGLAVRSKDGWVLTQSGNDHISHLLHDQGVNTKKTTIANSLYQQMESINDPITLKFANEAVKCYEYNLLRASVVLSWVGAISLLYNYVVNNKLTDFNNEARRRNPKWKTAKTIDDLARMREGDFLDILETISIIGKNVKNELKRCLDLRNGCGHPNTLNIGENIVSTHLEILLMNVFSKF